MSEKEYFNGLSVDSKHERLTLFPYSFWLAVILGLALAGAMRWAYAEPVFQAAHEGVVITLDSDKCELDAVVNLPFKATWQEQGKTYKGCWAARTDAGVVVAFFEDKTVALIPFGAFKKVVGA